MQFARACIAVASLLVVAACAPGSGSAQPPHPMGPGCTWPAELDPQRDGLAVLAVAANGSTMDLVLLDVATGGVRARCAGMLIGEGIPGFEDGSGMEYAVPTGSVLLPTVSPDWRWALSSAGAVELSTGRVVPEPDPGWRARALPGADRVLRERVPEGGPTGADDHDPASWCLAPRLDAPAAECVAL